MSNQENSNLQSGQEDTQNLAEEQLEEVTGGNGDFWNKVAQCFACGNPSTVSEPRNSPVSSPERRAIISQMIEMMDNAPKPEHWKVLPEKPRNPHLNLH